jgi:hypothetical protein
LSLTKKPTIYKVSFILKYLVVILNAPFVNVTHEVSMVFHDTSIETDNSFLLKTFNYYHQCNTCYIFNIVKCALDDLKMP